jgi:large subunit ribosomal protein L23
MSDNPFHYDVIRRPVNTEKSHLASEQDKVTFLVDTNANKLLIAEAVAAIFGVKVIKVNIINVLGKKKVFRGRLGQRSDVKKAIVTLAPGEFINMQDSLMTAA